jgi:hypothetical protein
MREIKFRAKCVRTGEWRFGYLANSNVIYEPDRIRCLVDPKTVGQFTGLLSKNRQEIYEGDIYTCTMIEQNRPLVVKHKGWQGFDISNDWAQRFVIIGNIHDNPELLEEECRKT